MGAERGAASPGKTDWFSISAVTGQGFAELEEEIGRRLLGADSGEGELYIDSRRQFDLLQRASSALAEAQSGVDNDVPLDFVAADLRDAVDSLGEITGEVTSADILGRIFSDFCVGK
jgi:tRNA modification GTPase